MSAKNKAIVEEVNDAMRRNDIEAFLARYAHAPEEYEQTQEWLRTAGENVRGFMELARAWTERQPKVADGEIPKPAVDMRITPKV